MEAPKVALQGLQPIARRDAKVLETSRRIEDQELAERRALDLLGEAFHALSAEDVPRATVGEACNHAGEY
jgi:hypothetical protein